MGLCALPVKTATIPPLYLTFVRNNHTYLSGLVLSTVFLICIQSVVYIECAGRYSFFFFIDPFKLLYLYLFYFLYFLIYIFYVLYTFSQINCHLGTLNLVFTSGNIIFFHF